MLKLMQNIPLKEKLAKFEAPNLQNKTIMLHAVSVGEVLSLENLIKKIIQNQQAKTLQNKI